MLHHAGEGSNRRRCRYAPRPGRGSSSRLRLHVREGRGAQPLQPRRGWEQPPPCRGGRVAAVVTAVAAGEGSSRLHRLGFEATGEVARERGGPALERTECRPVWGSKERERDRMGERERESEVSESKQERDTRWERERAR